MVMLSQHSNRTLNKTQWKVYYLSFFFLQNIYPSDITFSLFFLDYGGYQCLCFGYQSLRFKLFHFIQRTVSQNFGDCTKSLHLPAWFKIYWKFHQALCNNLTIFLIVQIALWPKAGACFVRQKMATCYFKLYILSCSSM